MREKGFMFIGLLLIVGLVSLGTVFGGNSAINLGLPHSNSINKEDLKKFTKNFRNLQNATTMYYLDMGFWPPDVSEGVDPGFTHKFPWNPYTKKESKKLINMKYSKELPPNWVETVKKYWHGPYIKEKWPMDIPWGNNLKIEFENWLGNTENRPKIVGVTVINLPISIKKELLELSRKGKFPFELISTNFHSNTDITMVIEEDN